MQIVLLVFLAILPTIVLFAFIFFVDKYDREPIRLLLKIFVLGMLSTIPTIIVELIGQYLNIFRGFIGIFIEAFIVVALVEEYFKRRVVIKHALNNPAFNERLDGIVYCAVASLGFATFENIAYVFQYFIEQPDIWLTRALLSVPTHMLLGITMGYFLSLSKFCTGQKYKIKYMKKSLLIPVILHGIYDFILMYDSRVLFLLFYPFVIYLWISNMKKLKIMRQDSKRQHGM